MDEILKKPLVDKIVNACIEQLKYFDKDITQYKISSYVFLTSDVYQDIGVCYCDESDLIDGAKVIDLNSWTQLGYHSESFTEVNKYIDVLFDIFYEGELEADPFEEFTSDQLYSYILSFFEECYIRVFKILKEKLFINTKYFNKDILMGVLMVDPLDESCDSILRISKVINTPFWHEIVKNNVKGIFN